MSLTCILLTQSQSLLGFGLSNTLMRSLMEIELVTSEASELMELINEIGNIKPDVILIGESMSLARKDALFQLMMCFPELRVIVISEDTNWLHVFHKKDWLITSHTDLLDIVYSQ